MPLSPGTKLGQYEVVEAIGAGGMGEVYRARDTKLGRDVAIKVLPEEFARDQDRLDRFEREARLLAQLNHANIATLHGLEEHDGQKFLIMELVEGETLAERIARGAIPIDEAVPLCIQIADGLEAAHEKGILHRDLKPANIKLGPDGKPKILDFGLAKPFATDTETSSVDASQSPTLTKGTALGAIIGTAAYMSPEQAKGQPVDKRTDIFVFGCVLYECLTGKKAFEGETFAETLGAVIHKEPDWAALPANTPSNIRRLLKRCFEKDARRRTRDIGDVALELADMPSGPAATPRGIRWQAAVPVILLLISISYFAGTWRSSSSTGATEWDGEKLGGPTVAGFPVVSPDDTLVAFRVQDRGLTQVAVIQSGGSGNSRQLTHDRTRGFAGTPSWSPDSSRIYFHRRGPDASSVYSISGVGDAEERLVLEDAADPRPLPDGSLLAVRINGERLPQLIRYRPGTNNLEPLPVLMVGTLLDHAIEVVPGGREAVVAGRPEGAPASENHLYVVDLDTGAMRRIAPDVTLPIFEWTFPLSVTPDEAYFRLPAGDLHQIVAVRLNGAPGVRPMLSLTRRPLGIDIARDGTLYLDQIDQPTEILRVDPVTREVEHFPLSTVFEHVLPLPGNRFLVAPRVGSRDRLKVVAPPAAPVPFLVDTDEETRGPLALVGADSVAFLIGTSDDQQLALASIDGRLQQRISIRSDSAVTGLAASPDGTSLYYAADGVVHRVSSTGGDTRPVNRGNEVAVDPSTGDLVILRWGEAAQLVRAPAAGGSETSIAVVGDWSVAGLGGGALMGHAVASDGRLVIRTRPPESWMFPVGTLDGRTGGAITPFLDPLDTDMGSAGWDRAGRVVTVAHPFRSELWSFRPAPLR